MLDPKKQQTMDQGSAFINEAIPPFLFTFYNRLQEEGFTEGRAFEICKIYLFAFAGGKYCPGSGI